MKYLINPLTGSNLIYKHVQNTGLFLVHLEYPFKAQSSTWQYDEYKKYWNNIQFLLSCNKKMGKPCIPVFLVNGQLQAMQMPIFLQ